MKKVILLSIALALMSCGCTNKPQINSDLQKNQIETPIIKKATYFDIEVAKAKILIDSNPDLIIIDVSPNYAQGHIPGAINYYIGNGTLSKTIPSLDKNRAYLVYCHNDVASTAGAQMLANAGFKNVYRLEGNYTAWVNAGYDIEK